MTKKYNAFKVGVFTLLVLLIGFAVLIWISKWSSTDTRGIVIRFKPTSDMPSLGKGCAIIVGGQKIGAVEKAWLETGVVASDGTADGRAMERQTHQTLEKSPRLQATSAPADKTYVTVAAAIDKRIVIRNDSRAFAEGPPLGGDAIIKIELGTKGQPLEGEPIEIMGSDPGGFGAIVSTLQAELNGGDPTSLLGQIKVQLDPGSAQSLMAKLLKSMDDINAVTVAINKEFTPEQKDSLLAELHGVMNNVNVTTAALRSELEARNPTVLLGKVHAAVDSVNSGLGVVSRLLNDNEPAINRAVGHVESTTRKLDKQVMDNIVSQTDPSNRDGMLAKVNLAAARLAESLEDIHAVTGTLREVIVINRPNIDKLLVNLKETSDLLRGATRFISQRPWLVFQKPSEQEIKLYATYDAARSFAEAANQLDDAAAQLKALSDARPGAIPADDPDLCRIQSGLEKTFAKFKQVEAELWQKLNVK